MSIVWMLTAPTNLLTCFTSFCLALPAFVAHVTAFTGLRVMLSAFREPLSDFTSLCWMQIVLVESLQARGLQTPATKHLLRFTSLCMVLTPLEEPLPACMSLCEKLIAPTKSQLSCLLSLYQHLRALWDTNCT